MILRSSLIVVVAMTMTAALFAADPPAKFKPAPKVEKAVPGGAAPFTPAADLKGDWRGKIAAQVAATIEKALPAKTGP